jgi:hypothetical protein
VKGIGIHDAVAVYDEQRIKEGPPLIGYVIDARRQRYPGEMSYPHGRLSIKWTIILGMTLLKGP